MAGNRGAAKMKDFKYYEEKHKNKIMDLLKNGPVRLAVDLLIESPLDLEKASVQHATRRIYRKLARSEMKEATQSTLRSIIPVSGSKLNGLELDNTMPLPVFAPEILDTNEISEEQLIAGLYLMLKTSFEEYYLKLLRSFKMERENLVPEMIEMLDGVYWKRRKLAKGKK